MSWTYFGLICSFVITFTQSTLFLMNSNKVLKTYDRSIFKLYIKPVNNILKCYVHV